MNPVVKLFMKVTNIIVKMKLLQVLIFLSLFLKVLGTQIQDEFSESGEESCSETYEDDSNSDIVGAPEHRFLVTKMVWINPDEYTYEI